MLQRRIAVAVFLGGLLSASTAFAAEGIVEATGEAMIQGGDKVAAKKNAIADAQKNAIDKIVGVSIKNEFTAVQQEIVKNNQDSFYSNVKDKLVKKSSGFIKNTEVLAEKIDGDVFKVKIRVEVYESKIKMEASKLADLLVGAGNPKLMVLVQTVLTDEDGEAKVLKSSTLGMFLERAFKDRGFKLVGTARAHRVAKGKLGAFDELLENNTRAIKMARKAGADILISGRIDITDHGDPGKEGGIDLGGMKKFGVSSAMRGYLASTGEVISPSPVNTTEIGLTFNSAVKRLTKSTTSKSWFRKTFDQLMLDVREQLRKMMLERQGKGTDSLNAYTITVNNVSSFRSQAQPFLSMIKNVAGVAEAKQSSFGDGTLVIAVECGCSATDLQNGIFGALGSADALKTLDVESTTDTQLTFKL